MHTSRKWLLLAAVILICSLGITLPSVPVVGTSEITNGSFLVNSDNEPYLYWNFKSTDANDTYDATNLKFKAVVAHDNSAVETEYKDYSSYKNNTTILSYVKFEFGPADVPGGEKIEFTIYAYNGSIETANLLDTASGSAYLPNWGGVTTTTTTTTTTISPWYYFLIPAGIGAVALVAAVFLKWYYTDK